MTAREPNEPLSQRRLFQTTELDEARAIVADKFCDHRLDIATQADRFDACHHRAEGRATSLNYIRYGADVRIAPGELHSFYLIQIPLAGAAEIDNHGGDVLTHRGRGSVLNPHRETRMRWREGCTQLLLQIDAKTLQNEAETLLGTSLNAPVTFETAVDETRPATANWVRKLKTCFGLAEQNVVFGDSNPGTQMRVERELIGDFLSSQPSNISNLIASAPGAQANLYLRRAVQFIHANLSLPLSVADIASAANTTPRNLQLQFQAEFGLTPMRYLRQERLALARRLILETHGGEALGDIADRAGFSHFGRFSIAYRQQFNEAPRDTKLRATQMQATVRGGH